MEYYNIKSILSSIGFDYEFEGTDGRIKGLSSVQDATENDLSFCSTNGREAIFSITNSNAGLILCNSTMRGAVHPKAGQGLVFVIMRGLNLLKLSIEYRRTRMFLKFHFMH